MTRPAIPVDAKNCEGTIRELFSQWRNERQELYAAEAELALLRAVEARARKATSCFEHASNCCRDWCSQCRAAENNDGNLDNALAALDKFRAKGGGDGR